MSNQFRMTDGPLLDAQGQLIEKGYQTRLSRVYDRSAIRAGALRIKEWDYYCVTSGSKVLALTIADNSYMGLDSISLLDVDAGWQHTRSIMRAFPMGKTGLPSTSARGDAAGITSSAFKTTAASGCWTRRWAIFSPASP
mgnify:CR=1 FL=1